MREQGRERRRIRGVRDGGGESRESPVGRRGGIVCRQYQKFLEIEGEEVESGRRTPCTWRVRDAA